MAIEDVVKWETGGHIGKLAAVQTVSKLNLEVDLVSVRHVAEDL